MQIDHLALFELVIGLICGFCLRGLVDKFFAWRRRRQDLVQKMCEVGRWR
jgi:UDP-N-acetylmuramyl pentapeptide phosphotransferase/UDP-N-acetylglucosamine-1-phosphate transferase